MGLLFESLPRPLLKSGLQPLARCGTHQETISRRHERMYTPSDTRLELPEEGLLFESDSNECSRRGALLKSYLGPLARYGTHQEAMSGRLEQVYLPSDSRLDLPGERPLFKLDFNKWWGATKCGYYSSHSLGHYLRKAWALVQIWHWRKSLSNAAEYCYQIC